MLHYLWLYLWLSLSFGGIIKNKEKYNRTSCLTQPELELGRIRKERVRKTCKQSESTNEHEERTTGHKPATRASAASHRCSSSSRAAPDRCIEQALLAPARPRSTRGLRSWGCWCWSRSRNRALPRSARTPDVLRRRWVGRRGRA